MALLGIGIIVLSFTFLAYRVPISSWDPQLNRWRRKEREAGGALPEGPQHTKGGEKRERDSGGLDARNERARITQEVLESPRSSSPLHATEESAQRPIVKPTSTQPRIPPSPPPDTLRKMPIPQIDLGAISAENATTPTLTLDSATPSVSPSSTKHALKSSLTPPQPTRKSSSTLMPPPSRPTSNPSSTLKPAPNQTPSALRPLPKNPSNLDPPRSLAASLRLPPSRTTLTPSHPRSTTTTASPSTSTLAPPSRPSRKVILTPGHSPLDWAALIKSPPSATFLRGADLPPHLIKVPPSMLKAHNGRKGNDAWSTWQGRVYNLTPYMDFHPGGRGELMRGAGKAGEAERLFREVHAWVNWEGILGECLVGVLVSENEAGREGEGGLEEMD